MKDPHHSAHPGYALGRLARALDTLENHADPQVRARAETKAKQWRAVLKGMASGELDVGSRTPVADTPAWVTLEVAHGGFATGRYLAEGPLSDEEQSRLSTLSSKVPGSTDRERLNFSFLSDASQLGLQEALRDGSYSVQVPEEGALPVVIWLLEHGMDEAALELLDVLRPLMHRLRFYPSLDAVPQPASGMVRLRSIQSVTEQLAKTTAQPRVSAMNEALTVWNPLYDRLVALWLTTVEGEAPRLKRGAVIGGWPCRVSPADFSVRRAEWLADYGVAAVVHPLCRKHRHPKSNFARLRDALTRFTSDTSLSERDVGWIRRALANTISRRGAPESEARTALRARQAEIASLPTRPQLANLVAARMAKYPAAGGLPSLDPITAPVAEGESEEVRAGASIPASMIAKAERTLEAPVEELVERGVIGSAEVLAIVLPQITSLVAAAGLEDPTLRELYGRIYTAFRRRRSLLLLNLEHQVRIEELPWVAAIAPLRASRLNLQAQAKQTLEQATLLAFTHFPHTLLPNPLVREMGALATRAELKIPFVEEIAADIFMGTFTEKWKEAAVIASTLLEGTLYARYYDLPPPSAFEEHRGGLLARLTEHWGKKTADGFAELCQRRSQEAGSGGSRVAQSGTILEQSQILTTHNVAQLLHALQLSDRLRSLGPNLAERTLKWIVRRQQQPGEHFKTRLQMVKNSAYAWRHAVLFLSFCEIEVQHELLSVLETSIAAEDPAWAARFSPAVLGLREIMTGSRFGPDGRGTRNHAARRFLGWSAGPHWILPPRAADTLRQ